MKVALLSHDITTGKSIVQVEYTEQMVGSYRALLGLTTCRPSTVVAH